MKPPMQAAASVNWKTNRKENMKLDKFIRDVPNFPKPGIVFKDITPLLHSPEAFEQTIDEMVKCWKGKTDIVAGLDARGFIFGAALAMKLRVPFMMIRKKGKLPGAVESVSYGLEYGSDVIEVSTESLPKGNSVLIVDDLLATGGTAKAAATLVKKVGYEVVGFAFVVELSDLNGRKVLSERKVDSVLVY